MIAIVEKRYAVLRGKAYCYLGTLWPYPVKKASALKPLFS